MHDKMNRVFFLQVAYPLLYQRNASQKTPIIGATSEENTVTTHIKTQHL